MDGRHKYIITRLCTCCDLQSDPTFVEDYLSQPKVLFFVNDFFTQSGPRSLTFVFNGELKLHQLDPDSTITSSVVAVKGEADGEEEEKEEKECKVIYFHKTTSKAVSQNIEQEILFGEMATNALTDLQTLLHRVFIPVLEHHIGWRSSATPQVQSELLSLSEHVRSVLGEAGSAFNDGSKLMQPNGDWLDDAELSKRWCDQAAADERCVGHMVTVVSSWCSKVGATLDAPLQTGCCVDSSKAPNPKQQMGPRVELQSWRERSLQLSTIIEQLQVFESKLVLGILRSARHTSNEANEILRDWKRFDHGITNGANEAKDNVKYLTTLDKYCQPLYSYNTLDDISAGFPALLTNMKMVCKISRYYNTSERLTAMCASISYQLVKVARGWISGGESLWRAAPLDVVRKSKECIELYEAYLTAYNKVKHKVMLSPTKQRAGEAASSTPAGIFDDNPGDFELDEDVIFGDISKFYERLDIVVSLFTTVAQFKHMRKHSLEGMECHNDRFTQLYDRLQSRPYDLLNHNNLKFDQDFKDFMQEITQLEKHLQKDINASFETIPNTEAAIDLLHTYQFIVQRPDLLNDLDQKHAVIFQNYGLDLDFVQKTYEKYKDCPPMVRTMSPVAGSIVWCRQLLRRIESPMKKFQSNKDTMAMQESRKIIRTYNRVASALVQFEALWHQAWCASISTAKAGLQATLIVENPQNNQKLYANFDPEIVQLIRETKLLQWLGVKVPDEAKMVLMQDEKFKTYYNKVLHMIQEYERIQSRIATPQLRMLLENHLNELDNRMAPGMHQITWCSLKINEYLDHIDVELGRMDSLLSKISDIVENRIEKSLKDIEMAVLIDFSNEEAFPTTAHEFIKHQKEFIQATTMMLDLKNLEAEQAVKDLVYMVESSVTRDSEFKGCSAVAIKNLSDHYNELVYHALLACLTNTFVVIKNRIRRLPIASSSGSLVAAYLQEISKQSSETPLFQSFIEISTVCGSVGLRSSGSEIESVALDPSLEEIQRSINECAIAILRGMKYVIIWGQDRDKSEKLQSFYEPLCKEKEVCKLVLLLTGALLGAEQEIDNHLVNYDHFSFLWEGNMQKQYDAFLDTNPVLENFDDELERFVLLETEINSYADSHVIGLLSLETEHIKAAIGSYVSLWKNQYTKNLLEIAREDLASLVEYTASTSRKVGMSVENFDDVRKMVGLLADVKDKESNIDWEIQPLEEKYELLQRYGVKSLTKEEMHQVEELRQNWDKLKGITVKVAETLGEHQHEYKTGLVHDVAQFKQNASTFRDSYDSNGPSVPGLDPYEAIDRLSRFERDFADLDRKHRSYNAGELLFGMPLTELDELSKTRKELKLLKQLYGLYEAVDKTLNEYKDVLWVDVLTNIDNMSNQVNDFQRACKAMPKALKEWSAYLELKKKIEDLLETVPLLAQLANSAMRDRHWVNVEEATKSELKMDADTFRVGNLLAVGLLDVAEDIEEISSSASKELQIETKLAEIEEEWSDACFNFAGYKGRSGVYILKGGETSEVQEALEESLMILGGIVSSRYSLPFREKVELWLAKLGETSEVIDQWLYLQMLWMNLEAVFTSGDIAKQLPQDFKRFVNIDKTWVKLMSKAFEQCNVVGLCYANDMLKFLQPMIEGLETCQKSLASYLETKRALFPRFYFVSDPVLLEVLSQGSDPPAIQPYFQACFDSIDFVDFDENDRHRILGINAMIGQEKEPVELSQVVVASGNIEEWMRRLEDEMIHTIHDISRTAAADVEAQSLETFISGYCAQICLFGIQMLWTQETETAIRNSRSDRTAMKTCQEGVNALMAELCTMTTVDTLNKRDRTNIETLITIQVHQKDVSDDLAKRKIRDVLSFEWKQQLRFYYLVDEDLPVGECCDERFAYQCEFLGCCERLVITPLTDRCYITLTQALGMIKGGAPAGPAGTGKTETTKDLARSLGKYCVVTNCGPEMDIGATGKIYKGLAMCGAWGCFDEFNRIDLEVLSVCAQQIACILSAIRNKLRSFQFLDGQTLDLNPGVGYFITMNPGYAGRQELPENLKELFRGVTMMVPDRQIIMKVKLAAAGYQEYAPLSIKFHCLYRLCEQQLSKQAHYDFGLRNILSVLRTAGAQLRSEKIASAKNKTKVKSENYLLCRTLRDMNMSKFVAKDVPLFLSLMEDLYPGLNPEKAKFPDVEREVSAVCEENQLILCKAWFGKIVQLYETCLVRHGIMVVGSAGGGKTTITFVLKESLSRTTNKHILHKMNPKALTTRQMYGFQDPVANEWTEGIFTALWKKTNDPRKKGINNWLVMDGPVDAIWIEDLNTVLDDNKMLTCANGDRIPMLNSMKIMFEPENLNNASPATVSRAGIIYLSGTDLSWEPIAQAWLKTRHNVEEHTILKEILEPYVKSSLKFVYESNLVKQAMQVEEMNLVKTLLAIMTASLPEQKDKNASVSPSKVMHVVGFALMWAFGGLLDSEDRMKYEQHLGKLNDELLPVTADSLSAFDYHLDENLEWLLWKVDRLTGDESSLQDFASMLVPTVDARRVQYLLELMLQHRVPALLVGGPGTAKTSIVMMTFEQLPKETFVPKRMNFSSATTPLIFQQIIEASIEKRSGKIFGPPANKKLVCFLDDASMPEINKWGDQVTLEMVRQLTELGFMWNLEKSKAGEQKIVEDLLYIMAMQTPGGGRNDIPQRMKRHCCNVNVPMPSMMSIHQIFGAILKLRFNPKDFKNGDILKVSEMLVGLTMQLYTNAQTKLLPTPAKFHYVFNLRDVSRVFQGVLSIPQKVAQTPTNQPGVNASQFLLAAWRHECLRVFQDKLIDSQDKNWLEGCIFSLLNENCSEIIPPEMVSKQMNFVDFMRDADLDPDTDEPTGPRPRMYEAVKGIEDLRERVEMFMYEHNDGVKTGKLDLVLFDDALLHMARISRIIMMPRGSALLVGVGGSGKKSLTRLASYIAGYEQFQITVSKSYNKTNLLEDIKSQYLRAGLGKPVTFIFTDAEVKEEGFLEYINMILSTGEIPGLLPKDEQEAMVGELGPIYEKATGNEAVRADVIKFFYKNVRDNLHMVLCFSPVGEKFRDRARKFCAVFSSPTIDWFLPWPNEALQKVASSMVGPMPLQVDNPGVIDDIVHQMAAVHLGVDDNCKKYFSQFRRSIYVTPKSYLSFIGTYKVVYMKKKSELLEQADKLNGGLSKLADAERDVGKMQVELQATELKLEGENKEIAALVSVLQDKSAKAEKVKAEVNAVASELSATAADIGADRDATEADLMQAQPAMEAATKALDAIKPDDIKALKALKNPPNIIKRIFDGVLLLTRKSIGDVRMDEEFKTKGGNLIMVASYDIAFKTMSHPKFLDNMKAFNTDTITDETCELMMPYLDMDDFTSEMAKKASGNVAGLCDWCRAMVEYYYIAKFVQPKIEALKVAEAKLKIANAELAEAEMELAEKEAEVAGLNAEYATAMAKKQKTQDEADATKDMMDAAQKLIKGLEGEKIRWTAQSKEFAMVLRRLVGDVLLSSAFTSYCGPFNASFRKQLRGQFSEECDERLIPSSPSLDTVQFLTDQATTSQWQLEGLPTDRHSLENGIMTSYATRWPLLIDPQNQGNRWIKNSEACNELQSVTLGDQRFRMVLENSMAMGSPLMIEHIEEVMDPVLEPVLNKMFQKAGHRFKIDLPDKEGCDYNMSFKLYFTTKLPNPHYSPELQAATTIIDFTVTISGLEDQLLSKVVLQERPDLEKMRVDLLKSIASYKAKVIELEAQLLFKLSSVEGNLLDDKDILDVLNNTKTASTEVAQQLEEASQTEISINKACDDYRAVAVRGSIIYFLFIECSLINPMYQTSLRQFLELFESSMIRAEAAPIVSQRCENIIHEVTYSTFSYFTRGTFERHKMLYVLLLSLKVQMRAGDLLHSHFDVFLKGGAALTIKSAKRKPCEWIPDNAWLNVVQLSTAISLFKELPDQIGANDAAWAAWYSFEDPEIRPVPHYEGLMTVFHKVALVRCLREDRTLVAVRQYIAETLHKEYLVFKPLNIEATWEESNPLCPLIFLLSPGSNPNSGIEQLSKRNKIALDSISMGQGQEIKAAQMLTVALAEGSWLLLQNTHLGINYMRTLEGVLSAKDIKDVHPDFRVWLTSEPHPLFPIGLLQMSIRMTDEPPAGIKAGLRKSFAWLNQDWIEAVNRDEWRPLLFCLCFLHTIVQERRKFGTLGFCIPYEFNMTDLEASAVFFKGHMSQVEMRKGQPSWVALRYMCCEVQYGGRITDNLDRRLFNTYGDRYLTPSMLSDDFELAQGVKVLKLNNIAEYREAIEDFVDDDHPNSFGMHANADLTCRTKLTRELFDTVIDIQPKTGSVAGGMSREELVMEQCEAFMSTMPASFNPIEVKKLLESLNHGQPNPKPLTVHLTQEIARMSMVIELTKTTLEQLKLAIQGTVIMTPDLIEALDCVFNARVPPLWLKKSWTSPTLGLWFNMLLNRTAELVSWLRNDRPRAYWLTGFFNAQGFLTAVQQEVTRQHQGWSLDDIALSTEVVPLEREDVEKKEALAEGVYVWGLFLEAAAWNKSKGILVDAAPKKLFATLPCLFVTAIRRQEVRTLGQYMCPCYTVPARTGLYFVFLANLKTEDPPSYWTMRGTALLCSKD